MKASPKLSQLLRHKRKFRPDSRGEVKAEVQALQLKMLRIQQGIWHGKRRAIIVFEGFDAAGKGGVIRRLTEALDPRGFRVHPIGAPTAEEQAKHWLSRFWALLPSPGTIAIFDRSWYGRVLVERVDQLTERRRWKQAYREVNEFEEVLQRDGIDIVKVFLAITKDEQLRRFESRLRDPYKQWKLTRADIEARKKWDEYVDAVDEMFSRTGFAERPWHLIPANHKPSSRAAVLRVVTGNLRHCEKWMEKRAADLGARDIETALKNLGKRKEDLCC